jgi:hypothetical protein
VSRSIEARLTAAEKVVGTAKDRWAYGLEQLIRASYGLEVGEPAQLLALGEMSLEELILSGSRWR